MDLINRLAKGLAAARAAVGSDELGPAQRLALEAGGTLVIQPRRRREDALRILRLETPLGEGLARIDLAPADARALAAALEAFADRSADEARLVPPAEPPA